MEQRWLLVAKGEKKVTQTIEEMEVAFKEALQKARDGERPTIEKAIVELKEKAKVLSALLNSTAYANPLLAYPQELSQARNIVAQIEGLNTLAMVGNPTFMPMATLQNQEDLKALQSASNNS